MVKKLMVKKLMVITLVIVTCTLIYFWGDGIHLAAAKDWEGTKSKEIVEADYIELINNCKIFQNDVDKKNCLYWGFYRYVDKTKGERDKFKVWKGEETYYVCAKLFNRAIYSNEDERACAQCVDYGIAWDRCDFDEILSSPTRKCKTGDWKASGVCGTLIEDRYRVSQSYQ